MAVSKVKPGSKNKKPGVIIASFLLAASIWFAVSLSELYTHSLTLPLRLLDIPEGLSTNVNLPSHINLRLKTSGWNFLILSFRKNLSYDVSISGKPSKNQVRLLNSAAENAWITDDIKIVDIEPDEITLGFEKTVSRKVPVRLVSILNFREGFGLAQDAALHPDSITVYGSSKLISGITEIPTLKLELNQLDKPLLSKMKLSMIPGIEYSNTEIEASFDVQRLIDHKIENVAVQVMNVPPDRKVILSPGFVTIGVHGGIQYIGKLQPSDAAAVLEYQDLVNDTIGAVEPKITLPPFVEKTYIEPQKIKHIIKKY